MVPERLTARLRSTEGAATSYCQPSHRFSDAEVEDVGRRNQLPVRGERPDPASDSDDHYPVSRRVLEHDRRPFVGLGDGPEVRAERSLSALAHHDLVAVSSASAYRPAPLPYRRGLADQVALDPRLGGEDALGPRRPSKTVHAVASVVGHDEVRDAAIADHLFEALHEIGRLSTDDLGAQVHGVVDVRLEVLAAILREADIC